MGEGEPGVEREERDFDGKASEQAEGEPEAGAVGDEWGAGEIDDLVEVEGVGLEAEVDDGGEGEERAGEGEEEEFAGGISALRAAPDADDEEHGDEGELEEDVEEQRISGEK